MSLYVKKTHYFVTIIITKASLYNHVLSKQQPAVGGDWTWHYGNNGTLAAVAQLHKLQENIRLLDFKPPNIKLNSLLVHTDTQLKRRCKTYICLEASKWQFPSTTTTCTHFRLWDLNSSKWPTSFHFKGMTTTVTVLEWQRAVAATVI